MKATKFGLALVSGFFFAGCAGKPVIQTQVIEKPVAVPCQVEMPRECKSAYAVDRVSAKDDALTINRALRAEIEERWACEIKLLAAVKGCNEGSHEEVQLGDAMKERDKELQQRNAAN